MRPEKNPHSGHRKRLRERFLREGLDSFAYHNVVELLLTYAVPRRDTNLLAHRLCEKYPSFDLLCSADVKELTETEGIGENAAALIKLIPALAAFYADACGKKARITLRNEEEVTAFLSAHLAGKTEETLLALMLDGRGRLLDCRTLAVGSQVSSLLDLHLLFQAIFSVHPTDLILAHNHPSGALIPSEDDLMLTKKLAYLCEQMEIRFLDHYLFAEDRFLSLMKYLKRV